MLVVVGTDGSSGGLAAVRWALQFCHDRREPRDLVDLVHVYDTHDLSMPLFVPTTVSPPGQYLVDRPTSTINLETGTITHRAELQDHYRHEAERLLGEALRDAGGAGGVHVSLSAVAGDDHGRALVDHAEHADLLVVGARGHARLTSHLLGSVSTFCVTNASCPVVVVRGR